MSDEEYEDEDIEPGVASGANRRPRGWLADDVKAVCDLYVTGELQIAENKTLTPHRAASAVMKIDGLSKAPSTGAVQAVFKRWEKIGFAIFARDPFAFIDYSEEGKLLGLRGVQDRRKAERSDSRQNGSVTAGQTGA